MRRRFGGINQVWKNLVTEGRVTKGALRMVRCEGRVRPLRALLAVKFSRATVRHGECRMHQPPAAYAAVRACRALERHATGVSFHDNCPPSPSASGDSCLTHHRSEGTCSA